MSSSVARLSKDQFIDTTIAGIPCSVRIDHFSKQKPDYTTWSSDQDYYGYTEMDWVVCDQRGRPAPWLEKKIKQSDTDRIEKEIDEHMGAE